MIEVCAREVVEIARRLGDPACLTHMIHSELGLAEVGKRQSEGVQRMTLLCSGVGGPGDRDRLFAARPRLAIARGEHQRLPVSGEHPCPRRTGPDRDEPDCFLVGGQRRLTVASSPEVTAEPLMKQTGKRLVLRPVLGEDTADQCCSAAVLAGEIRHLGSPPHERYPVEGESLRSIWRLIEEIERAAVLLACLGEAVASLRRQARLDGRACSARPMSWAAYQWRARSDVVPPT